MKYVNRNETNKQTVDVPNLLLGPTNLAQTLYNNNPSTTAFYFYFPFDNSKTSFTKVSINKTLPILYFYSSQTSQYLYSFIHQGVQMHTLNPLYILLKILNRKILFTTYAWCFVTAGHT